MSCELHVSAHENKFYGVRSVKVNTTCISVFEMDTVLILIFFFIFCFNIHTCETASPNVSLILHSVLTIPPQP